MHELPRCAFCGEEMRYNVPRLGHNGGYVHAASGSPLCRAQIDTEAEFYRDLLEQICQDTRNTRAKRLAESGLLFWDQMKKERESVIVGPPMTVGELARVIQAGQEGGMTAALKAVGYGESKSKA